MFSFVKRSKKKPGKNDEVSYYIEEPQPEPMEEVPQSELVQEVLHEPIENPQIEPQYEAKTIESTLPDEDPEPLPPAPQPSQTTKKSTKPGFFKFSKPKKAKKQQPQPQILPPEEDDFIEDPINSSLIVPQSETVQPEPVPILPFKEKSMNANIQDHENIVTEALPNQDSVPHDEPVLSKRIS